MTDERLIELEKLLSGREPMAIITDLINEVDDLRQFKSDVIRALQLTEDEQCGRPSWPEVQRQRLVRMDDLIQALTTTD